MEYRMALKRDSNGTVLVSFPDFPEAHTFGGDEAEARLHAVNALETVIAAYMADRRPIPAPTAAKRGEKLLMVPAIVALQVGLYTAMREEKVNQAELAPRLKWHVPQVARLFDLKHQSKLEQLEEAAGALGKRLECRVA